MAITTELSPEEKEIIRTLHQEGYSQRQIATEIGRSKTVVCCQLAKFRRGITEAPPKGRRRKLDDDEIDLIVESSAQGLSCSHIAARINLQTGKKISKTLVVRTLARLRNSERTYNINRNAIPQDEDDDEDD